MANINIVSYVALDPSKGNSYENPPEVRDVPMPNDKRVGVGLTCFFGFKTTMQDLSRVRIEKEKEGCEVYSVEMSSAIGKPIPVTMKEEDLQKYEVINLNRLSAGLEAMVLSYFRDFLSVNMTREEAQVYTPDIPTAITHNPELLADLHDQPEFSHMDVFVYTVGEGSSKVTRATLFSYKRLSKANYKNAPDDMPLYLPTIDGVSGAEALSKLRKGTSKDKMRKTG